MYLGCTERGTFLVAVVTEVLFPFVDLQPSSFVCSFRLHVIGWCSRMLGQFSGVHTFNFSTCLLESLKGLQKGVLHFLFILLFFCGTSLCVCTVRFLLCLFGVCFRQSFQWGALNWSSSVTRIPPFKRPLYVTPGERPFWGCILAHAHCCCHCHSTGCVWPLHKPHTHTQAVTTDCASLRMRAWGKAWDFVL